MRLELAHYHEATGWSAALPTELDSERTAVFAFCAPHFAASPAPLEELARAFPRSALIGCSTAGEIGGTKVFDRSISVAVARFEATRLALVTVPIAPGASSFDAGRDVARALAAPDLRGVIALCSGLSVNGSELIRGINGALDPSVSVSGGLAGDGERFQHTWVLDRGKPLSLALSALGFYGERVEVACASKGGWDIFGPERRITRAQGNVLYELDGKPALSLYKDYLGERASGLPATALLFPLAIRADHDTDERLVRTVLGVDEAQASLTFAGDIPQGSLAQLMRANFDRLVQGASDAGAALAPGAAGPLLSIAISCVGRRLVLGERTEEEIEATLDALPPGAQQVGFYSYGELSPVVGGRCELHNQTMTLTTLSER
jgi:hypothetical protein